MRGYQWEGRSRDGRLLKGAQRSGSAAQVRASLQRDGVTPLRIRAKRLARGQRRPVKPADMAAMIRELATVLEAGLPVVQALEITAEGQNLARLQELLEALSRDVAAGSALSEAMQRQRKHFDSMHVSLVAAGESSGRLPELLASLAIWLERRERIRRKIASALSYPLAVLGIAVVVVGLMLVYVVPEFERMFASYGAALPPLTRFVVAMSEGARGSGLAWAIAAGAVIGALAWARKRIRGARGLEDRLKLRLPFIRGIVARAALARFMRTLATLLQAGLPAVEALNAAAGACGNRVYEQAMKRAGEELAAGQGLRAAMAYIAALPPGLARMMGVGEETGRLGEMCTHLADRYDEELQSAADRMGALLEPLLMTILGILIGGLVLAMYLPIFGMGSVI
ncbi:type II secretion system F family protein [Candidatus Foliamicus sp.]